MIGRTKKSRAPENRSRKTSNEGRKFDTAPELLGKSNTKSSKSRAPKSKPKKSSHRNSSKTKKSVGRDSDSYAPDSSEEETAARSKSDMELSESLNEAEEVKQAVEDAPTSDFEILLAAGVPWKNNSCWIDSSLQVLYAAVVGPDYNSFQTRLRGTDSETPIGQLYRHIQACEMIESTADRNLEFCMEMLGSLRDSFRKGLYQQKIHYGKNKKDAFQPLWVQKNSYSMNQINELQHWFKTSMKRNYNIEVNRAQSYFQFLSVELMFCFEGELGAHTSIRMDPQISYFKLLTVSQMEHFSGKMERLLQDDISLDETPRKYCWAHDVDGNAICHGSSKSATAFLSIPVIMICDLEEKLIMQQKKDLWDYPASLNLLSSQTQDWVYDLVGRVFYNGSHYITRFLGYFDGYGSETVFAYDGMQNNGHCVLLPSSTPATHLAGKESQLTGVPSGYRTVSVIYRLRGGYNSQKLFLQHQIMELDNRYHVHFGPDDLDKVPTGVVNHSQYELFPDDVIGGIWMPTVGTSQYKLTSLLAEVDEELLKMVEVEQGVKRKHLTPEFSDNESLSSPQKRLKESADEPAEGKKRRRSRDSDSSSDIDFDCRCGEKGYSHVDDYQVSQRALMCAQCRCWSHLACTKGIAHPDTQTFVCHKCALTRKGKMMNQPALCRSNRT